MKKSIKILSLVLALALICGALVIGAFAKVADANTAPAGMKVFYGQDLQGATVGQTVKGPDGEATNVSTSFATGVVANVSGRNGRLTIMKSAYDNNVYITYENGFFQSDSGPYLSTGYKKHDANKDVNNFNTYTYQILDVDLAFPTGKAPTTSFVFENRGYVGDTAKTPRITPFTLESDLTNGTVYIKDKDGNMINLSTSEWNHLTAIVKFIDVDGTMANKQIKIYVALNGEIVSVVDWGTYKSAMNNVDQLWGSEIRINPTYSSAENMADAAFSLDNLSWRAIDPTAYDNAKMAELNAVLDAGVTASLASWSDSLYDAAEMPFGTLVATIGEGENIKYFDSITEAIEAAEAGQTVELKATTTELVTVKKAITVNKNGFTANLVPSGLKMTETEDAYVFEASASKLMVSVQGCTCGKACFGMKVVQVSEGANIWDAIVLAYGFEPTCSYLKDGKKYDFDGFTATGAAASFFEGGAFDKSATVTAEMAAARALVLTPAYKATQLYAMMYKNGNLYKTYGADKTLINILGDADAGVNAGATIEVVLYANYEVTTNKYIQNAAHVIVDLNGYTMKYLTQWDYKSGSTTQQEKKGASFISAKTQFTLKSSTVGAKVFEAAGYYKQDGTYTSDRLSQPLMALSAKDAVINIVGRNDAGENTLTYYGATVAHSYQTYAKVNVDGGVYIRNRGDNFAMFDLRVLSDCTFKNATLDGCGSVIFAFCGRKAGMGSNTANVTIDNCVGVNGTFISYVADPITVTITNTVIGGSMNLNNESSATAPSGNEVTIGKGCKIMEGVTFGGKGVIYAGEVQEVSELLTYKFMVNDWSTKVADNFALTEKTVDVNITKAIVDVFNVEFTKGGETVYTTKAYAGMNAVVPMGAVEGTMGMVNANAKVVIPADAKEGDKIEIPADAEIVYTAGKVPVQFSMSLTGHTTYNFFLPVVEGITYDATNALQHNLTGYNPARPATKTFATDAAGNQWMKINTWPGMYLVDESGSLNIKYSYNGTTLTYTIESFGALDYIEYILNNDKSAELKAVVANLVDVTVKFDKVKGSRITDRITNLIASETFKNAYKAYEAPATVTNKAVYEEMAKGGYVTEIALVATAANTGLTVGVKQNGTNGFKFVADKSTEYGAALVGETRIDGSGYFFAHNVRTYTFNNVLKIEVYEGYTPNTDGSKETNVKTFDGKVLATYEWTLAGYINDNAETLAGTDALAYAKAIYSMAEASEAYMNWKIANGLGMFA